MPAPPLFALLVALALAAADGPSQRSRGRRPAAAPPPVPNPGLGLSTKKPNIVLILTDDQDVELGSLSFMPKTLRAIRDHGAEFRHAYVTTPMCCPSRSSLLTGMYVHNHHVYTNNDNCSSTQWQATHETRSFATYLSNAGYRTGYFGKYLNKYNGSYIPPGWREWGGLIMNSKYYNYSINMNGQKIKHGFDYQKDYYPDLIANDSLAFLRHSKRQYPHKPVMLTMSFPAPHGPEDSAPQYSHLFFNVTTHHTPSYDYAPNPDKQWILQVTQKMAPIHRQFTNLLMTKRLQTLQSVDDAVERVVSELEALGELDNTYVVYTSDHGYHLGQFGLIKGKSFPFEFDVRVPLLVRGPGVATGAVVDELVLNIDLAPTFLDMAGVTPPPHMDGRSALPLFVNPKRKKLRWPDTFLIESSGRREVPPDPSRAVNRYSFTANLTTESPLGTTARNVSLRLSTPGTPAPPLLSSGEDNDDVTAEDDEEFDEEDTEDDDEVEGGDGHSTNPGGGDAEPASDEEGDMQLDNRLLPVLPNHVPKTERLAIECIRDEMKLPCRRGQKWYCENYNGRWRKHKCKLVMPIPLPTEREYRKCACFTPDGLIYKKLPLQNITKRDQRLGRIKRDADLNEILFEQMSDTKVHNLSKRERRDILSRTNNVMESVQGKINMLQLAKNISLEENDSNEEKPLETNNIVDDTAGCIIERGRVNCSNIVYQDKKTWLRSRHRIDNEIQQLRMKLQTLKEIKRHLKQSRPEEEEYLRNTTDLNRFNELNLNFDALPVHPASTLTNNRQKNRKRPHVSAEVETPRSKRPRLFETNMENITLEVEVISKLDEPSTTENTLTTHAHRHHHKQQTEVFDVVTPMPSTEAPRRRIQTTKHPRLGEFIPYPNINQRPLKPKPNFCHCQISEPVDPEARERDAAKEEKRRMKEERLRKKLRKQRRKESMAKDCSLEKMNCFQHDNDHWKTAPLWSAGPFCFCANANNNTYACARTINATHDSLYCEFTTGLRTYYNLRIDPFELQNRFDQLKPEEKSYLHDMLQRLVACKGKGCIIRHHDNLHLPLRSRTNILPIHTIPQQRFKKRKFSPDGRGGEGRSGSMLQFSNGDRPANLRDRDKGGNGTRAISGARRRRKITS